MLQKTPAHLVQRAQDKRLRPQQDPHTSRPPGTSPRDRQKAEACLVRPPNTTRQPAQDHPSGHNGGRPQTRSAKEKLGLQCEGMDRPWHARASRNSPPARKMASTLGRLSSSFSPMTTVAVKGPVLVVVDVTTDIYLLCQHNILI